MTAAAVLLALACAWLWILWRTACQERDEGAERERAILRMLLRLRNGVPLDAADRQLAEHFLGDFYRRGIAPAQHETTYGVNRQ